MRSDSRSGASGMRVPPVTVVLACGAADRRSRFRVASHKRLDIARSTNPNTSLRHHRKFVGRGASYEWMTTRRRLSGTLGYIATMASRTIGLGMLLAPQPAHRNETPWDFEPSGYSRGRTVAQDVANIRTRVWSIGITKRFHGEVSKIPAGPKRGLSRPSQPDGLRILDSVHC